MSLIDGIRHRLRVLMRSASYDRELDEVRKFHIDLDAAHREHAAHGGLSRIEAEGAARRRFGNITVHK